MNRAIWLYFSSLTSLHFATLITQFYNTLHSSIDKDGSDYFKISLLLALWEACSLWNVLHKTMYCAVKEAIELSSLFIVLHEGNDNLNFTYQIMSAQLPE